MVCENKNNSYSITLISANAQSDNLSQKHPKIWALILQMKGAEE